MLSDHPYKRIYKTGAKERSGNASKHKPKGAGASVKKRAVVRREPSLQGLDPVEIQREMERKSQLLLQHNPADICQVLPCGKLGLGQRGLYASMLIPNGTLICPYTGSITITDTESAAPVGDYVFTTKIDDVWVSIDAEEDESIMARYANHGDLPNTEFTVIDGVVYIKALTDIKPNLQIIISYTDQAHKFFGFIPKPINAGDGALSLQEIFLANRQYYDLVKREDGSYCWQPKIISQLKDVNLDLFTPRILSLEHEHAYQVNLPWINCNKKGVLLSEEQQQYLQPFSQACAEGNLAEAIALYPAVADPHYIDHTGQNALMYLCRVLLNRPDPAKQDLLFALVQDTHNLCAQSNLSNNNTPLHFCVLNDNMYMAGILMKEIKRRARSQEVNFTYLVNDDNVDVLSLAIRLGNVGFVKLFISNLYREELFEECYLNEIRDIRNFNVKSEIFDLFSAVYQDIPPSYARLKHRYLVLKRSINDEKRSQDQVAQVSAAASDVAMMDLSQGSTEASSCQVPLRHLKSRISALFKETQSPNQSPGSSTRSMRRY